MLASYIIIIRVTQIYKRFDSNNDNILFFATFSWLLTIEDSNSRTGKLSRASNYYIHFGILSSKHHLKQQELHLKIKIPTSTKFRPTVSLEREETNTKYQLSHTKPKNFLGWKVQNDTCIFDKWSLFVYCLQGYISSTDLLSNSPCLSILYVSPS